MSQELIYIVLMTSAIYQYYYVGASLDTGAVLDCCVLFCLHSCNFFMFGFRFTQLFTMAFV